MPQEAIIILISWALVVAALIAAVVVERIRYRALNPRIVGVMVMSPCLAGLLMAAAHLLNLTGIRPSILGCVAIEAVAAFAIAASAAAVVALSRWQSVAAWLGKPR